MASEQQAPTSPDADPAKVALALLHILRAANTTRESESAG
jgi:hypothetical protein